MQYRAVPYKMRSHEDDEEDGVADDAGQRDHIVGAAVEDAVDDVIHVVLVVCHQYRQLSWCDHPIVVSIHVRTSFQLNALFVECFGSLSGPTK